MGLDTDFGFDFNQPPPKSDDPRSVVDAVLDDLSRDREDIDSGLISDISRRAESGVQKYGVALTPFNGRDAVIDAYSEALDLVNYLKQSIMESETLDTKYEGVLKSWYQTALKISHGLRMLIQDRMEAEKDESR